MLRSVPAIVALCVAVGVCFPGAVVPASASECSQSSRVNGECPSIHTEVGSDSVSIGASQTTTGTPGTTTTSPPRSPWTPPPPRSPVLGTSECSIIVAGRCRAGSPPKNPPTPPAARVILAPTPPSTISDLAEFRPEAAGFVMEPGSWSVPRLPTNVFSTARVHQASGQLLGWPIEVRFTPQAFRWAFGDGATRVTQAGGSSWGASQFSATSTSHVYRQPGVYFVSLTIEYSVAYRFGAGTFLPLAGTISQSAGQQTLTVLRVTPVLVDRGCEVGALRDGRC